MCICVITYYCKVVVGPGTQYCALLEVWVLGVGMSTLDAQTALYAENRGLQVSMTLEHGNIVGTQCCDSVPRLIGPDFPSIVTRQLGREFQIGMFRPIRVDHTNGLQVTIKTHSFTCMPL
jgi:hypothetical protein